MLRISFYDDIMCMHICCYVYVQLEIVMIKRHARPTKCENHGHLALEFRCRPFILEKKMEKIVVLLISV